MFLAGVRNRRTVAWASVWLALWSVRTLAAPDSVRTAGAGDPQLPAVHSVLERFVAVTGGRAALLRHRSITIHGHYRVPARHLVVQLVSYGAGIRTLQAAQLPSGKSLSGYDGHTAWDLDADGKVTIHEGDEVKSIARDADMYYRLHVLDYFRSMQVIDVRDFAGHSCFHLKGINNWGRLNEQFYDRVSGLLIGYAYNTAWRGGRGDATTTFAHYRDFDGLSFATEITNRDGDELSVLTIESISYDDVDDAVFIPPAPVRERLAAH
jgi:hypothetical protein